MKRKKAMLLAVLLVVGLALSGCSAQVGQRYQTTFLDLFDTVTVIQGYATSQEAFTKETDRIYERMLRLHRLYDIYHEYDGMVNICTVNAHAEETLTVEQEIIDLLLLGKQAYEFSGGLTDVTMGRLLNLWHEAREAADLHPESAALPSEEALREAATHRGFDRLEIDAENRTVRLTDPLCRLDVGALAKGFAVQQMAADLKSGYLLSVGGNVYATGPKPDGSAWSVGIQDPDNLSGYLHVLKVTSGSVVTSGDYQRYFTVDGKNYHHIIDPETCYPATRWRAVSVVVPDSGLADALSTTLFLMSREEGQKLLEQFGAEAMWMNQAGEIFLSPGYQAYIK